MSHAYKSILWNRQKLIYDSLLWGGIMIYITCFISFGMLLYPQGTFETLLIRATSTCAFILMNIILSIGPICRLNRKFLPMLYNRRHMGVTMFFIAFIHGAFSILQFHAFGEMHPILSIFLSNTAYFSLTNFPFQVLGFFALVILLFMAATSHDFWLKNLSPPIWKSLHMLVYVAYTLIILHITLGILQDETHPIYVIMVAMSFMWICGIHLMAAWKEKKWDNLNQYPTDKTLIEICAIQDIPLNKAKIICINGERIAIFRTKNAIGAISNVCQHQNGPLGEGCIVDGYVTCPWHGFQYKLEDGQSPPPFNEKIATYHTKIVNGKIWLDTKPLPPGTYRPLSSYS